MVRSQLPDTHSQPMLNHAQDPPRNCQTMWAIIGGVSIISPVRWSYPLLLPCSTRNTKRWSFLQVLMLLLRKVIQPEGTSTPMEDAGEANDAERSFELTVTHEYVEPFGSGVHKHSRAHTHWTLSGLRGSWRRMRHVNETRAGSCRKTCELQQQQQQQSHEQQNDVSNVMQETEGQL